MTRITKLLVANRGEIARRIMRTAREMGIGTAAVYANPDAAAPFVREADIAIALGGDTSAETYLDIAKLIAAAKRVGADAIHPGYGFLSENAAFAQAVIDAGLVWVGPHPEAIAAMGDKLAAKRLLAAAGVPMLESIETQGESADLAARVAEMGYPVLVKAAAGGGGRGMRVVQAESALDQALKAARREAAGAFGNDTVFIERYLESSRHIEVQIFGDKHGNLVHCFERECSIQRRHQKIIEEAPSSAVDAALRERLGAAAVAAGRAIGYDNAGTVEFLVDASGGFYFLEVNTRLQVEHPVTEEITGLDLVREQIRVAEGEPLSFTQESLRINGHAIEARLYAESPEKDFLPAAGRVVRFEPDPAIPVRIDSGVETGSEVSVYFDPMLAKVIVHAPTREEAALRLASALERLRLHGLTTNRDFLVNTLRHPAFLDGDTTTHFIEHHNPARSRRATEEQVRFGALAAALVAEHGRRSSATTLATLPSGWRNNRSAMQTVRYLAGETGVTVGYARERDGSLSYDVAGHTGVAHIGTVAGGTIDLDLDGVRHRFVVTTDGGNAWVQGADGEVALTELPRFPRPEVEHVAGGYEAPMPGKVVAVHVAPGDKVSTGQLLLILEAMKMEHRMACVADGVVAEVRASEGGQVEAGQLLLVIQTGEPG
jgi:propionyl-CoA carboxylase alpha chain